MSSSSSSTTTTSSSQSPSPPPWKAVHVNDGARMRRVRSIVAAGAARSIDGGRDTSSSVVVVESSRVPPPVVVGHGYNYGMSDDGIDRDAYRNLFDELDEYMSYMTVQRTSSSSTLGGGGDRRRGGGIIREETARVYMTHARLFLGWIVDARGVLISPLSEEVEREEGSVDARGRDSSSRPHSSSSHSSPLKSNVDESVRKLVWSNVRQRTTFESSSTPLQTGVEGGGGMRSLRRNLSLCDIFPNPSAESASPVLQYVLWLRSERGISQNYEANILRGMIKLVKYRFANEIVSSFPSSTPWTSPMMTGAGGGTMRMAAQSTTLTLRSSTPTLDDLPIVIELRKLHREAGNRGKKAPRSSDEDKKWLDWSEYLKVIRLLKSDLNEMIKEYDDKTILFEMMDGSNDDCDGTISAKRGEHQSDLGRNKASDKKVRQRKTSSSNTRLAVAKSLQVQRREIANIFQRYLILSFFACIPDRQRTFRELELGKNFFRVENNEGDTIWIIKHTADDYKTGSTYGERPPLPLTAALTPYIDDFINRWRPSLLRSPTSDDHKSAIDFSPPQSFLFLQSRTGNPLTANSIYQIVSRSCYKYKQRKTNPHLLRDMIVTHVRRNSDASEKELEALALFMGHSIQMQRDSYDRRTLDQKVSPAIKLMQDMNAFDEESGVM
ncbi:hypothetical protein ACHAXA_009759 [Cyclostephanos tholiformis]|uniref:Uncharacterized protein n=1 Tax=Cyclostephanos tholiformis TaxID=382380 RepID=A0ABD3SGF9_9STRA